MTEGYFYLQKLNNWKAMTKAWQNFQLDAYVEIAPPLKPDLHWQSMGTKHLRKDINKKGRARKQKKSDKKKEIEKENKGENRPTIKKDEVKKKKRKSETEREQERKNRQER